MVVKPPHLLKLATGRTTRMNRSADRDLSAVARSAERRAELADDVAERARQRAKDAADRADGLQATMLELESRLQQAESRGAVLRGVCERIVNDPLSKRDHVQGILLNAVQRFDGRV